MYLEEGRKQKARDNLALALAATLTRTSKEQVKKTIDNLVKQAYPDEHKAKQELLEQFWQDMRDSRKKKK